MCAFLRLCLGVFLALAALPLAAVGTAAAAPADFTVQAGAVPSGPPANWDVWAMLFEPTSLTIDAGDSVTWNIAGAHTVTFGAPPPGPPDLAPVGGTGFSGSGLVSSGLLMQGQHYQLTFPKAGTYTYGCLIHPASMKGSVVVQPAGTPYPVAPGSDHPASNPAFSSALSAGQAAIAAQTVQHTTSATGVSTWTLAAGFGDGKSYAAERFGSPSLTIHTGDTVVWTQNDPNELHTVTFLNPGQDVPFALPTGALNPQALAPAGGKTYAGSGFFNSGGMGPGQRYTLTFSTAGTYTYKCLLHDEFGMVANLTVVGATPAQIPAAMPSTGSGGGAALWGGLLLFGLLTVGLGLTRLAARRS